MSPDHDKLYWTAERQAGYFTSSQAQAAGFSRSLLSYYARTGHFERVWRGVYRLTRFPATPNEDLFVAWLRVSPNAVISHESALALYELSDVLPSEIHLTIPRTASRRHRGVRLHTNRLEADEVTQYSGLPITAVPRTIADVAVSGLADELVLQAIREALRRGLTTPEDLMTVASRRGGRARLLINRALHQRRET